MITVVGMGRTAGDVTARGERAIKSAKKVFLRTALTRTAEYFRENGIAFTSFDELYESAEDFGNLNALIAERLVEEGRRHDVCYCVDGSGSDDGSVIELAKLERAEIIPGVSSFADALKEGATSKRIYSAYDFAEKPRVDRSVLTVIKDIDSAYLAGEIKLILSDLVGEEEDITYFKGEQTEVIKVFELDRREFSYDTGVIIPKKSLTEKKRFTFDDLIDILIALRGEGGCPWDREQTHQTLRKNLIEECYELVEGIDNDDLDMMEEETGDVLLQAAFHARVGEEAGEFTVCDVLTGLCTKLINRHEHVFGEVKAGSAEEALRVWENAKKKEKNTASAKDQVDKIAKTLPSLMRAGKVIKIAKKAGMTEVDVAPDELNRLIAEGSYGELLFKTCCLLRAEGKDLEEELGLRLNALERAIGERE